MSDFTVISVSPHPPVYLLRPNTYEAREWVSHNIAGWDNVPKWGRPVPVERRYIGDIVNGILNDGLSVA